MILFSGDNSGVLFITSDVSPVTPSFRVAQAAPKPEQYILLDTKKTSVVGGGAWAYYPPIYSIRARGNQTAPAPKQKAFAKFIRPVEYVESITEKLPFNAMAWQTALAPNQSVLAKSKRSRKAQEDEEKFLLMLLGSL